MKTKHRMNLFIACWSGKTRTWLDFATDNSRLSTACYCEHGFNLVLYLAYKYGRDNPAKALLQNVMVGGHSTARGAILGAILGAYHGSIPFADDLCAKSVVDKEVQDLVATVSSRG